MTIQLISYLLTSTCMNQVY